MGVNDINDLSQPKEISTLRPGTWAAVTTSSPVAVVSHDNSKVIKTLEFNDISDICLAMGLLNGK